MTVPLHPCSSCARHVRVTDARCPFCGRARVALSIAGATAIAVAVAATAAACASQAPPIAAYGGPPVSVPDAGVD